MTIKCELTMLTFTKTKNTRLPDSVHNAGVTLQSRDIPHTLPSPIFYERAPKVGNGPSNKFIFRTTYGNSIVCNIFPA
jgi:hypothetical protein